jgi:hypothetical protein
LRKRQDELNPDKKVKKLSISAKKVEPSNVSKSLQMDFTSLSKKDRKKEKKKAKE